MWSFLRQYLTESEAWLLLPVLAAVCMAIGSFYFLQSAVERRSTVSDSEKADWKKQLLEQGKQVYERAKQKAEADAATMFANQQEKQQKPGNSSSQLHSSASSESSPAAGEEIRQRKGKTSTKESPADEQQQLAADDSGAASDNDWELVDDERIARAEESEYQPPIEYQQAVEAFIEALHELPPSQYPPPLTALQTITHPPFHSNTRSSPAACCSYCCVLSAAVDELHMAIKEFFSVLCSLLDGSSHITPLPSTRATSNESFAIPPSSSLTPSDRYATRNVLLSRLVDTQSLHALHQVSDAHPGTALASDAEHLHHLLVPVLHSH